MSSGPLPGWYTDPEARHEFRYWDGSNWTDHVADRGITAIAPLGSSAALSADATEPSASIEVDLVEPGTDFEQRQRAPLPA